MGYSQNVAALITVRALREREKEREEQVKMEKQDKSHNILCNVILEVTSQHFASERSGPQSFTLGRG